ncbi:MAG: hypothetical protein JST53_00635 [Actinobacteria bacterium]|nr:hypothetical protein [Actinomycetota bacterium]
MRREDELDRQVERRRQRLAQRRTATFTPHPVLRGHLEILALFAVAERA